MNYQRPDYIENNEVVCFGLSEHVLDEVNSQIYSDKAAGDLRLLASWFPRNRDHIGKIAPRPAYQSDFNYTNYHKHATLRTILGIAIMREFPIKNFYVRCWVGYFYVIYFIIRGNARGFNFTRPLVLYGHPFNYRSLLNYPDLYNWVTQKVLPKLPVTKDPHREWMMRQNPIFHQYHKTVYRYKQRKPRYVPWDGTMSQPTVPYLVDLGTDVINGTFK